MITKDNKWYLLIAIFLLVVITCVDAGEVKVTTYYPAPYGEYKNLKTTQDAYFATDAGNVGIGTTTPASATAARKVLHIRDTANDAEIRLTGSGGVDVSLDAVGTTSTCGWLGTRSNHDMRIGTHGNTKIMVLSDGRIGIGTLSPRDLLNIVAKPDTYSPVASFESNNPEPPYVNWYHKGSRYGYIRAGDMTNYVAGTTWGKIFQLQAENGARFYFDGGDVGIGTPNPQAKLDVTSTTSGILPPRMTTAHRNAISSPPEGLMIYNTTTKTMDYYNGIWRQMGTGGVSHTYTGNRVSIGNSITGISNKVIFSCLPPAKIIAATLSIYSDTVQDAYGTTKYSGIWSYAHTDYEVTVTCGADYYTLYYPKYPQMRNFGFDLLCNYQITVLE